MTRDEAVARIQRGLGFRDDLTTEIVSALQEARRLLEMGRSLPSFLLQESQVLVVPTGSAEIALPSMFIREFQEEGPWFINSSDPDDVVFLEKLDYNIGKARFVNTDSGAPQAYTLRKNSLVIWPERDIDYTLTWSYYKRSVALDSNVANNEWLVDGGASEALIGRGGMIIAADLLDTESLKKFSSMYQISWDGITNEDQLGDEENRPLAIGSRL